MSSDPVLNCILEVCCGRATADQQFAKALVRDGVCETMEHAEKCVAWVRHRFDLAPVNTLGPLKNRIIDLAKGSPFKEGDE
jgi:hypothetical protein